MFQLLPTIILRWNKKQLLVRTRENASSVYGDWYEECIRYK